ncbi:LysR family transcriptional regulator [Acuticoccus sediminis]|uniref:LysR family transcriptional regulator n=1 Tax=Acuticoccus sediminis TaxID=2184697 RepID=A0A8B2NNK9_9HYPH|nr:LysR substrate-binding domain-containing protein [Acuticoccus sediminis]RAH98307.1 LysR family transcriptional regulator [Acuticoccus sediminis]
MIDIRQLRYFVALAETLHFGRAAERLNVTQPPLSRQLAALEAELGVKLIERHSRRASLTPAGERFLEDSRAVLVAFEQACRNARRASAGELGDLTIGFMMHAAHASVPVLTRRFLAARPDVRLQLLEAVPSGLIEGLREGRFDAVVTFRPEPVPGVETMAVHREPLCLAVPAGHELAAEGDVSAAMLAGAPLVASPPHVTPTLRKAIVEYFAVAGLEPHIRLETQLQQTIVSLVAEGIGVALVPRSVERLGVAGVTFRVLTDAPVVEQVLAWRTSNLNPALPRFLEVAATLKPD